MTYAFHMSTCFKKFTSYARSSDSAAPPADDSAAATAVSAAPEQRFTAGPVEDRARYEKLTSDLSAGEKDELEREEAARRRDR